MLAPFPKPGTFPLFLFFSLQSSDVLLKADQCIFFVHVYTQGRSSAGTISVGEPLKSYFPRLPLWVLGALKGVEKSEVQLMVVLGEEYLLIALEKNQVLD